MSKLRRILFPKVGNATVALDDQPAQQHGFSENADFFGGYECLCGEASWNPYHASEVGVRYS